MVNLLGLTPAELQAFCSALGEKPYRAKQLLRWIHHAGADSFAAMTDISKVLRVQLEQTATIAAPAVRRDSVAADGTRKWLLDVGTGNAIETVFIPETARGTLCISSQAGCALECDFCSTGRQGFNRNLTVAEIVGQLWLANRALGGRAGDKRPVTNVVMMGMGEPLANFENVVAAMQLMPLLERTELFVRSIGEVTDIVEKEMYTFVDSLSAESLTLRPEGTASCVRAVLEHNLLYASPQRLWYGGPMFRHERPQKGRYRQFHQFGVEALGYPGPDIDVEHMRWCSPTRSASYVICRTRWLLHSARHSRKPFTRIFCCMWWTRVPKIARHRSTPSMLCSRKSAPTRFRRCWSQTRSTLRTCRRVSSETNMVRFHASG